MENREFQAIENEIKAHRDAIARMKGLIPWGIAAMLAASVLMPLMQGRNGPKYKMTGYPLSVVLHAIFFLCFYWWGYKKAVGKRKTEIKKLEERADKIKSSLK